MKLTLSLPPSINATYKTGMGRFYKSQEARAWESEAGYLLLTYKGQKCFEKPVYVGIEWFLKRDRDIDAGIKIVLDLLQSLKIIQNDKLVTHLNVKKYGGDSKPRVEIQIEELG